MKLLCKVVIMVMFFPAFLNAEEIIGYPGRINGRCEVIRRDTVERIQPSTRFYSGDTIRTYSDGRLEVVLLDETVITVGPDTEVNLSQFILDTALSKRKGILRLINGRIFTILRKIYKGIKGEFSVETNTAIVGVRGTRFMVFVYSPSQTEVIALEDSVYIDTPFGGIQLEEGFRTSIFEGEPPSPPERFDIYRIKKLIEEMEPSTEEGHSEPPPEGERETFIFPFEDNIHMPPVNQTVESGAQDLFKKIGTVPVDVKILFPK